MAVLGYMRVFAQAELHVNAVLRREDEAAPGADKVFYGAVWRVAGLINGSIQRGHRCPPYAL